MIEPPNRSRQVTAEPFIVDHTSYIDGWLKALKSEKCLFLKAAGEAQRAVNWTFEAVGMSDTEGAIMAAA